MSHGHRIKDTRITHWKNRCTFISWYLRKCDTRNRQTQTHPIAVHIHSDSQSIFQSCTACVLRRGTERISYPHEVFRSNRDYRIYYRKRNRDLDRLSYILDCESRSVPRSMRFCMTCTYARHASRISFCSIFFTRRRYRSKRRTPNSRSAVSYMVDLVNAVKRDSTL